MSSVEDRNGGRKYDLVFVDPPYASSADVCPSSPLAGLLEMLGERIAADGIVVVRTALKVSLQEQYGRLQVAERRQWGTMAVAILRKSSS